MNHIITISREFGSGGRTVGKKVAEQLGIPCYDSELIQKIAEESGFAENYVKEAGEYMICPLSSRQVKYLKVSDKNTYISFWSVGIFMHTISLYIF